MSESPQTTILIIGAGAAGLAAGRALRDAGCDTLILEARDRIGGRVYTVDDFAPIPVELGAEFIHGERAVTHDLLQQAGLSAMPVVRLDNLWWAEAGQAAVPRDHLPPELKQPLEGLLADYHSIAEIQHMRPPDVPLEVYLLAHGWTGSALEMADVLLAQTCCARLDSLSCRDLIREMKADHAGTREARIAGGYRALFQWYSRDLPVRLNTPASEIRWNRDSVTVISGGSQFLARKCIITVPVSILQRNAIRFDPPLSAGKWQAIEAFGFEPATKLIYRFREPLWPDGLTYMAHLGLAARWWTAHSHAPVITCFVTADRARKIDALDKSAALDTALRELGVLLDIPLEKLRAGLLAARRFSWANETYTLGGYAHVPPGAAEARPMLAQPEGDVLFFAGEATAYDTNPQTVHGAVESGWRAARECLAQL